jgi:hypothetical protein
MRNAIRLLIATLLLIGSLSTSSLADGGAPVPMCLPGDCPGNLVFVK